MRRAITFDFHDTLVHCDEWFQLEVYHLPSAFLAWHAREFGELAPPEAGVEFDCAYRRLRLAIIQHGHELNAERSLAVVFSRSGLHVEESRLAHGVHDLMRAAVAGAHAVAGAPEAIRAVARHGTPLAVVSSAVYHPFLEWSLAALGLRDAFGAVVTSAASGYYKSRPEIYWQALAAVGASSPGSVHVGDSARFDVDGAAAAGMRSVWLDRGSTHRPRSVPALRVSSLDGVGPRLIDLVTE